jgi:three-Cys-motif partner protein
MLIENNYCIKCDHEKNAPNGVCLTSKGTDGLNVRCVGGWAKDKYYYIGRYLDMFTISMRQKWQLYYIDLFSGCGKCRVRETGEEIDGSGLIALNLRFPFNKYFFIDLDNMSLQSLQDRVRGHPLFDRISFKMGDCNELVMQLLPNLPNKGTLYLVLIDPTGLQISFDTIRKLTSRRRADLVITFPEGMAIKRNIDKFFAKEDSLLDDFMGDRKWRDLYNPASKLDKHFLVNLYKDNLRNIDYQEVKTGFDILIRSTKRRLPLYFIIFASKNPLGYRFWSSVSEIDPTGQRRLKF